MKRRWYEHARAVILAGLLAASCGLALWTTHAGRSLEDTTISWRFRLRPTHPPKDLAIVAIDDATFSDLYGYSWPYKRSWHGRVLDELRRLGARKVIYDVQFTEASKPREDLALFDAVGRFPGTILATTETNSRGRTNVLGGEQNLRQVHAVAAMARFPTFAGGEIARVLPSYDGVPTIATAAAAMLGHPASARRFERGGAWIDFRGPPGTIPSLHFSDVLNGRVPASAVRGKIVIVGMTSPTMQDVHPTPTVTDDLMSGPEVQANALWTVLHGLPLRTAPDWAALLAIFVLALGPAFAALRLRTLSVLTAPLLAAGYLGVAYLAFVNGWILPVFAPLACLAVSAIGTVTASYVAERRLRRSMSHRNLELEQAVRERTAELQETQLEVVRRLARAAEWRDEETGEHVERIGIMCERLALAAGMAPDDAETLRHAAVLHDIGKIGVPDRVLLKPGKLDAAEWEVMKTHAQIGASMLSGSRSPLVQLAEVIARTHHERWDGTGYPEGLSGEAIPLAGRVCALCDVYDALLSVRPYKSAWPAAEAIAEIASQRGKHFDPRLTDLFLEQVVPTLDDLRAGGMESGEDEPPALRAVA